ncbi:MAG: deoxyribonuclease IV [Bacilli bacterium]
MLLIGSHVSFKKDTQLLGSVQEAIGYGANTFMFYTGAPQNTMRSNIDDNLTLEGLKLLKDNNIDYAKVIVHAPYIVNLANKNNFNNYIFSINFLTEEIRRCELLGVKYLVLHPGNYLNIDINIAINNISDALNKILFNSKVTILLETMAGKGTEVGSNFKEIKELINKIENKDLIGVCMDTCHLNDSGYNISNFDTVLDEFDEIVGLNYLKCIHINDSKNEIGMKKDRHENIGYGSIGFNNLINIIYNKRLTNIPKILETPYYLDKAPYKEEIEMIKNKVFKDFKN